MIAYDDEKTIGWKMTALSIRDAALAYRATHDVKHIAAIEDMYFKAAMFEQFTEEYKKSNDT